MVIERTEYDAIREFYGDRAAARSGVPYINHIIEGCAILKAIDATDAAQRAFAIHPMCQMDEDLAVFNPEVALSKHVLMLAMEYRNIANNYLSFHLNKRELVLSPLKEVNDMLIADKVQNYKDFILYHQGTHPRSEQLEDYFSEWLAALGINIVEYERLAQIAREATA